MVTDFRQLNKKLVKDKYPIQRFEDIFDGMGNKTGNSDTTPGPVYFSVFDLTRGF